MDQNSTSSAFARELLLPPEEQWTLHHILLHRIEQESGSGHSTSVNPPRVEVFQAFEQIDAGRATFTTEQLEAMEEVLAEYHHSTTWWELERPQIESLLHRIATLLRRSGSKPTEVSHQPTE